MDPAWAADLGREAIGLALRLALPLLVVGTVVGFLAGLFQAATQVQDASISAVPRLLAAALALLALLPWMLGLLSEYAVSMFSSLASGGGVP